MAAKSKLAMKAMAKVVAKRPASKATAAKGGKKPTAAKAKVKLVMKAVAKAKGKVTKKSAAKSKVKVGVKGKAKAKPKMDGKRPVVPQKTVVGADAVRVAPPSAPALPSRPANSVLTASAARTSIPVASHQTTASADVTFKGKVVCILGTLTGLSRPEAVEALYAAGAKKVNTDVSRNVDIVVQGVDAGPNLDKARYMNKCIIDEGAFKKAARL